MKSEASSAKGAPRLILCRAAKPVHARAACVLYIVLLNACNPNAVKPDQDNAPVTGEGVFFPAQAKPSDTPLSVPADRSPSSPPSQTDPPTDPAALTPVDAATTTVGATDTVKPAAPAAIPLSQPPRPTKTRSKRTLKGQNSLYDRSNPAYDQLQKANQALAGFPADNSGQVDWVEALRQGKIKPRAALRSQGKMEILTQELIMKNTREMPWVRFPHEAHTQWLTCKNCHDRIFKPIQGSQKITMDDIFRGRYCGVCHDRVSFSVFTCERCHSVVHPDSPKAWWTQ